MASGLFNDLMPSSSAPAAPGAPRTSGLFDDYLAPPKNEGQSDFLAGVKTSFKQLPEIGWGLAAITAAGIESAVGEGGLATGAKKFTVAKMQEAQKSVQADQREVYDLDKAWSRAQNGDLGALVDWAQYAVGYGVGQGAQVLATGGVGKVGAQAVLRPAVEKLTGEMVAKEAAQIAATEAGKKLTEQELTNLAVRNVAGNLGETAAIAGYSFGMEGGEIGGDLAEKSVKEGRALTGAELARGLGSTLLAGSLEYGENLLALGGLKGKLPTPFAETPGVAGRVGRAAVGSAVAAPIEAGTEYLQTGLEEYGKGNEQNMLPFNQSDEAQRQAFNAAGLGAVGGVTHAGVGGLISSAQRPSAPAPVAQDNASSLAQQANLTIDNDLTPAVDAWVNKPGATQVDQAIASALQTTSVPLEQGVPNIPQGDIAQLNIPQMRSRVDREAELLQQADQAGTDFDRRMAMEQLEVARPEAPPRIAEDYLDLTPMDERQANLRLGVMRDVIANAGGNSLELAVVPHPGQAGKFAIGKQALPNLDLTPPAAKPISEAEANARLESAAMVGQQRERRAEDQPRQDMISRAMANIEARDGVASPYEAELLRAANMGQPYNRIDPNIGRPASVDEKLTAATGVPVGQEAGVGFGPRVAGSETQRVAALQARNDESMAEQTARNAANRAQAARATQAAIDQSSQQPALPPATEVIAALATPGTQRTAEQQLTIKTAQARYPAADYSILDRAARAPFQLDTLERLRLRDLREGNTAPAETPVVAAPDTSLVGTRVLERLGQPSGGLIITSNAKLSTQRNVTPGVTVSVKDGDTNHQAAIVDPSKLGATGRLLQQVARIFGKRLVAFESNTLKADGFVMDGDNRSIFINTKTQMSPLAVFGHELTHLLKRDNPQAYAALQAVVERELGEGALDQFEQEYGAGADIEELTSDLVGNRFQDADFWSAVFDEIAAQNQDNARSIITRLAAALNKAVNAILKLVRQPGFQADQYVKDLSAIKSAVKTALAQYAQDQRATAMQLEAETAQAQSNVDLTASSRAAENVSTSNQGSQNARFSVAQRGAGLSEAAAEDGRSAGEIGRGEIPSYGTPRPGAISVVGRHYSTQERQSLDGFFYGQGLRGAERDRLAGSTDPRLRQRVYFYADTGAGIRPEGGVGSVAHEVRLNNIYDPASRLIPPADSANAFESAVLNAGFDGYKTDWGNQSAVVLLGPKHRSVPVRVLGQVESAPAPAAAAPSTLKKGLLSREVSAIDTNNIPGSRLRNGNLEIPAESREAANAELERIGSTARFSRQRAIDTASLDESLKIAKSHAWPKGRDLKLAIQQKVLDAAIAAGLDVSDDSPETRAYLRDVGLRDALAALRQNPNAIGWYDLKTRQALAVMALVHPEIARDENARFAFTWALAVTSNGLKVGKNFELAERVYEDYKRTGRMPTNIGIGTAGNAINDSLELFNQLRAAWGMDNLREFMQTNFTVSEITGIAKELKPGGEHADVTVKGAAILGPKIGNGFFSNLYGNFDALTMDRWLIRTWGRWTGTLIKPMPEQTAKARDRLDRNLSAILADPTEAKRLGDLVRLPIDGETDVDQLARAVQEASMDPATRAQLNETSVGLELRKAGNSLAKYLDGQKEAPAGPTERKYIRDVFASVLAELRKTDAYKDLTMADLQAVLWYAEKRLYETAKEDPQELAADEDVEGYADEDAPDYANAAANVARQKNITDRRINAALKRIENERSGTAGSAAGASPEIGQASGAGQQGTVGGFTRQEKRRFIGERAVLRARADRASNAQQPGSYQGDGGKDGGRVRVLKSLGVSYTQRWKLDRAASTIFRANELSAPEFFELAPTPQNAQRFQDAISENKAALKFGAAVTVYPASEYQGMRLFLAQDGKSGVAIKPDGDIVSVFSTGGAGRAVMELAVTAGGRKLDAFDTILPEFYAAHGFRAVARTRWNDEFAPDNWNKSTYAEFNNGEPDVVFMVYDPAKMDAEYTRRDGRMMDGEDGYDRAVALQTREMRKVQRANPTAQLSRQRQVDSDESNPAIAASRQRTFLLIHGGSDFDEINPAFFGAGEPGGLRPLGNGFYGYLVRSRDDLAMAVRMARAYIKYAPTDARAIQAFKLTLEPGEVSFKGRVWDESLLSDKDRQARADYAAANELRGPERRAAYAELEKKYPENYVSERDRERRPLTTEVLYDGKLIEAATGEPSRLERLGKWPAQMDDDAIVDQLNKAFPVEMSNTALSRQRIVGDSKRQYTPEQLAYFQNVGRTVEVPTLKERITELRKDLGKKLAQGIVDQFMPIKELTAKGYTLARLSKGAHGAFEAMLHHGKLSLKDGAYDADMSGGFIDRVGRPLHGELEDFLWWVAANRADRLSQEDRENLFTPADIAAGKSLDNGTTNYDYTLQHGANAGTVTRDRTLIYRDALKSFDEFNKNAMDMAEQSGLIDAASRPFWEHEFYVPFYRVEDDQGGFVGGKIGNALVRQEAFKRLKGGTNKLNSDLLANTLSNWGHLIDAAAKNRAATETLSAAERLGAATRSPQGGKGTVWVMENGQKAHYRVEDPYLLDAISSLEYAGLRGPIMDALAAPKHWLTIGVTASPAFKIRNLVRDSVQAVASAPLSYNLVENLREGIKASDRNSQTYVSALASGGLIRFGSMLDGNQAAHTRRLINMGVNESTILDSDNKVQAMWNKLKQGVEAYNELGNRGEEINRAALFKQLTDQGMAYDEAALMARDLMDFSMQGSWTSVRFLTQVVPFMNARLQGLYKLGRAAKEDPQRFGVVLGSVALASIALMLAYEDDDDWKKREDWDRNNFWWFKVNGVAFRIPKPFEIGAMATLAERGLEYFNNPEMTGQRLAKNVSDLVLDQLSMNPIPQVAKPLLDVYSNKDSFTGRPIETLSMERLQAEQRYTQGTSMVARGISSALSPAIRAVTGNQAGGVSPVQVEQLLRGYFSWLGSFAIGGADMILRPLTGQASRPTADYWKLATGGIAAEVESGQSRYVSQMYDQAKTLEQAMGTYRMLMKTGQREEARAFFQENKSDIVQYGAVEKVKAAESRYNEMIRMIERSSLDPDVKKDRIRAIERKKDALARVVAPGYQRQSAFAQ